jgi:hypothetical protein
MAILMAGRSKSSIPHLKMPEMGSSLARAGAGGDTEAQGKRAWAAAGEQAGAGLSARFGAANGAGAFTGAACMALLGSGMANMEAKQPMERPISSRPWNSASHMADHLLLAYQCRAHRLSIEMQLVVQPIIWYEHSHPPLQNIGNP